MGILLINCVKTLKIAIQERSVGLGFLKTSLAETVKRTPKNDNLGRHVNLLVSPKALIHLYHRKPNQFKNAHRDAGAGCFSMVAGVARVAGVAGVTDSKKPKFVRPLFYSKSCASFTSRLECRIVLAISIVRRSAFRLCAS
jgi:hypothetical protein